MVTATTITTNANESNVKEIDSTAEKNAEPTTTNTNKDGISNVDGQNSSRNTNKNVLDANTTEENERNNVVTATMMTTNANVNVKEIDATAGENAEPITTNTNEDGISNVDGENASRNTNENTLDANTTDENKRNNAETKTELDVTITEENNAVTATTAKREIVASYSDRVKKWTGPFLSPLPDTVHQIHELNNVEQYYTSDELFTMKILHYDNVDKIRNKMEQILLKIGD